MTACDLCASAKPWDVQVETVKVIFEEFYEQVRPLFPCGIGMQKYGWLYKWASEQMRYKCDE